MVTIYATRNVLGATVNNPKQQLFRAQGLAGFSILTVVVEKISIIIKMLVKKGSRHSCLQKVHDKINCITISAKNSATTLGKRSRLFHFSFRRNEYLNCFTFILYKCRVTINVQLLVKCVKQTTFSYSYEI